MEAKKELNQMKKIMNNFYEVKDKTRIKKMHQIRDIILESNSDLLKKMLYIVHQDVQYYMIDFYKHDIEKLAEYEGTFIWIVRESGTHLIPLQEEKICSDGSWLWEHEYNAICQVARIKDFYYYNGKELLKINKEKANKIINEYKEKHIQSVHGL